jgi:hypothetical protein
VYPHPGGFAMSQNGSWVLRVADEGEFHIGGIDVRLAVDDVYKGIDALPARQAP